MTEAREIIVIGAGPAGSIASALLRRHGHDVLVLERERFPRFSIGESLLAHCVDFIAEAGMLEAVEEAGFQVKNGAVFTRGGQCAAFDFADQFTQGRSSTWQVPRGLFDELLADEADRKGVEIRYGHGIEDLSVGEGRARVVARDDRGAAHTVEARFLLDASGFGRVLARRLGLERPSCFPVREALFTHVADSAGAHGFDRNKIRIVVHPQHKDVWFWLIPFADGRSSIGVVARPEVLKRYPVEPGSRLQALVEEDPGLEAILEGAAWDTPVRSITGYSANVSTLHGPGFALLGNAAEFLDPVFSSGVTIAMRSASMAAGILHRQLAGDTVDWEEEFARPLRQGVDTFRAYVEAWYDGRFQDVVFYQDPPPGLRAMICSVLAGYAWDRSNPFAADAARRLDTLAALCASPAGRAAV